MKLADLSHHMEHGLKFRVGMIGGDKFKPGVDVVDFSDAGSAKDGRKVMKVTFTCADIKNGIACVNLLKDWCIVKNIHYASVKADPISLYVPEQQFLEDIYHPRMPPRLFAKKKRQGELF